MKPKHWIRIALIALLFAAVVLVVLKVLAFSTKVAIWVSLILGVAAVVFIAYKVVAHATRN